MNILTAALLIGIELLEVHGPDGQIAFVNTSEISTLRAPTAADLKNHFPKDTHCLIVTTNGKFLGVIETCGELRKRLEGSHAK